jgi:hypothetical protein
MLAAVSQKINWQSAPGVDDKKDQPRRFDAEWSRVVRPYR